MKINSFDGEADIHGTKRSVAYAPEVRGSDGEVFEEAALVIKGLSFEDALHVIDHLHGGLLKGADAANEAPAAKVEKKVEKPKPEKAKVIDAKAEEKKPEPKPAPKVEAKVEVVDESDDIADDLGDDDLDSDNPLELDYAEMAKQEKLRPIIEHMVSRGFNTTKAIVDLCVKIKDKIPALVEVDKKGNFEKRMERAAMVVTAGEQAS